jgi:chaperonin cofactor prefoldin
MGWYYMANIKEKIYAEMENITKVLIELEKVKDRPNVYVTLKLHHSIN